MSSYLSEEYKYTTCKEVGFALKEVNGYLNKKDKLEDLSFPELKRSIYRLEKSALSMRKACEKRSFEDLKSTKNADEMDKFLREKVYGDLPVSVEIEDKVIKISTPLLFTNDKHSKENLKYNYQIQEYVSIALEKWKKENGSLLGKIKAPYVILIKRFAPRFVHTKHVDNDNFEAGRVINLITSALGYSDNCAVCTTILTYETAEKEGMEFIVFAKEDLKDHLSQL